MTSRIVSALAPLAFVSALFATGCADESDSTEASTEANQAAAVVADGASEAAVDADRQVPAKAPSANVEVPANTSANGTGSDNDTAVAQPGEPESEDELVVDESDLGGQSPSSASVTLYFAWQNADRDLAETVASEAVLEKLFQLDGRDAGWTFQGCEDDAAAVGHATCAWSYIGGAAFFAVAPTADGGSFGVTAISYLAD